MRVDKYLADMGIGTRSELKKMIRKGLVKVDGVVIKDPGFAVKADTEVLVEGRRIIYAEMVYLMLNKPAGVISATEDPREKTVVDLIDEVTRRDIFPVGRLDKDTEGLLLLTNDGELAHRLLSPKHHVDKTYLAYLDQPATEADVKAFAEGIAIEDEDPFVAMPAVLELLPPVSADSDSQPVMSTAHDRQGNASIEPSADELYAARITIREGKFHQVKRMFAAVGKTVTYLKRETMGPLALDASLPLGAYRPLTEAEIRTLKNV
ncbi:MAG: pseudouridine synthase [Lachnospiraceae bacterium]|nr:pseudouridine synthase [Lachnospiraceae bacterium]